MDVISINIRPDYTEVAEGFLKKNQIMVRNLFRHKTMYPFLTRFREEEIAVELLEILEQCKKKKAQIFISVPDDLVKIDCGERDYVEPSLWETDAMKWVLQLLQIEKEGYYIQTPIHIPKANRSCITGMAIPTAFIETLWKAASLIKVKLNVIETASFSFLRYLNQWDREHCIMHVWDHTTTICGYSPIKGMFKLSFPSYGWKNVLALGEKEESLNEKVVMHDVTAFNTYGLANTDIPIYLISPKQEELSSIISRQYANRLMPIPNPIHFLNSKQYGCYELSAYAVPLGLMLRAVQERMSA